MDNQEVVLQKLLQNPYYWDPLAYENEGSSVQCLARLKRDIDEFQSRKLQGVYIEQDENDLSKIHAILAGCINTPYQCGFFYFILKFPPTYPEDPPRVRLMTTGDGFVRFNPRFFPNGKVCLSILGTFLGPGEGWTQDQSLTTVLRAIQELMNGNPYTLEPGFEVEKKKNDMLTYFHIIQHETVRVAVCETVEACLRGSHPCPPAQRLLIMKLFNTWYPNYVEIVRARFRYDGHRFIDPFGDKRPRHHYKNLLARLENLKQQVHDRLLKHA